MEAEPEVPSAGAPPGVPTFNREDARHLNVPVRGPTFGDDGAAAEATALPSTADLGCRSTIRNLQQACASDYVFHNNVTEGPLGETGHPATFMDSALGPDGELLAMTGYAWKNDPGRGLDRDVVAVDAATGETAWTFEESLTNKQGDFEADGGDIGYDVEVTPSGDRVVIVGASEVDPEAGFAFPDGQTEGLDFELTVTVLTDEGQHVVTETHDAPIGISTSADKQRLDVQVGPDGEAVYVSWWSRSDGAVTRALSLADGSQLWSDAYSPNQWDHAPSGLAVSPDGETVFVGGTTTLLVASYYDIQTAWYAMALDASTGERTWKTVYDAYEGFGQEVQSDLALGPEGERLVLTGHTYDDKTYRDHLDREFDCVCKRGTVAEFDPASGALVDATHLEWLDWTRLQGTYGYHLEWQPRFRSLELGPEGDTAYVTGYREDSWTPEIGSWDPIVAAVDLTTHSVTWTESPERLSDTYGDTHVFARELAVSPDGERLYVGLNGWPDNYPSTRVSPENGTSTWVWATDEERPDQAVTVLSTDPAADGERRGWTSALATGSLIGSWGDSFRQLGVHVSPDGGQVFMTGTDEHPPGENARRGFFATTYPADGPPDPVDALTGGLRGGLGGGG
jgi:DNA-binding beta-propeller fold protein YncE